MSSLLSAQQVISVTLFDHGLLINWIPGEKKIRNFWDICYVKIKLPLLMGVGWTSNTVPYSSSSATRIVGWQLYTLFFIHKMFCRGGEGHNLPSYSHKKALYSVKRIQYILWMNEMESDSKQPTIITVPSFMTGSPMLTVVCSTTYTH